MPSPHLDQLYQIAPLPATPKGTFRDTFEDLQDNFKFTARSICFGPTGLRAQVAFHVAMIFALLPCAFLVLLEEREGHSQWISLGVWITLIFTLAEMFVCFGTYGFRCGEYMYLPTNIFTTLLCGINLALCIAYQTQHHFVETILIHPGLAALGLRGLHDLLCIVQLMSRPIKKPCSIRFVNPSEVMEEAEGEGFLVVGVREPSYGTDLKDSGTD